MSAETLWTAKEAAAATGGRLNGNADWQATGASIDSRSLQKGDLFIALHGANDGHDYVAGALDNVSVVIRATVVQLHTPDALRGRVSAVNRVFISSSNELGAFESGLLAALTSPVFTAVFGGVATIAFVLGALRLFPEFA